MKISQSSNRRRSLLAPGFISALLCLSVATSAEELNSDQKLDPSKEVRTYGRFVPEREDDFAWENDKIAFRIYGPASKGQGAISGVDAWFKKVDYSIIDKWYAEHLSGKSYHEDHGEGLDIYHTGNSRGVGGSAVWLDGKPYPAAAFNDWKIIDNSKDRFSFQVTYDWPTPLGEVRELKTISIDMGSHFYQVDSQFLLDGKPAQLPLAVGLATHDGKASVDYQLDQAWISTWEAFQDHHLGTGAYLHSSDAASEVVVNHSKIKDQSHIWLLTQTDEKGQFSYSAGFAWTASGAVANNEEWLELLSKAAEQR